MMEKFLRRLYYFSLTLFMIFVIYMCSVLAFSARKDALHRGFIPCTEQLVNKLSECGRGAIWCTLGSLWQNTKCNVAVVSSGFSAWLKKEQKTPWENYLFEPVFKASDDADLITSGESSKTAAKLHHQYNLLESKQQQEEQKIEQALHLDERVLRPDFAEKQSEYIFDETDEISGQSDDIADEAFMDEISALEAKMGENNKIERPDIVLKLQKITKEKLHKKGVKNEQSK